MAGHPLFDDTEYQDVVRLFRNGDLRAAENAALALIEARPLAEFWNLLGVIRRAAGQARNSLAAYRQALSIEPENAGAWTNLGNTYKDLKLVDVAVECQRKAIRLQPGNPSLHHNLGVALMAANRCEEALLAYERALLISPGAPRIRWDRALALLAMGRYSEGWLEYEARRETGELPNRPLPGQLWRGEPLWGKTLLVASEQGYGDTIWASRFLPRLAEQGARIILECRAELLPLMALQGHTAEFVAKGDPLPEADYHSLICSIPGHFVSTLADIDGKAYLKGPVQSGKFESYWAQAQGRLKAGIIWSGSVTFKANQDRALNARSLADMIAVPGVQLYSLQMGEPREQLAALRDLNIIDLAPALNDFSDTAEALHGLDLVIMTDSAVAHLAGALGRPVWVLLNRAPYWMWGRDEARPVWYDSVRLFRQPAWDNWTQPLGEVAAELLKLLCARPGGI